MMKKHILILCSILLFIACSSVKDAQESINSGNYDRAINLALINLKNHKTKKKHQPYVIILEEAYKKATIKNQEKIAFLIKDGNPENYERIYDLWLHLENRQQQIKPLLPLRVIDENRDAVFVFTNYDDEIIEAKQHLSNYLYDKANLLMQSNFKYDYRKAYEHFNHLEQINPNYKNTRNLLREANLKGIDYVHVKMSNQTEQVVPKRLEDELLNFDTFGLDDLWTVYHSSRNANITYDFGLELNLKSIEVSPEKMIEKQFVKQKKVKDGVKKLLDKNGNQVKDSLGNPILVDQFRDVRCQFFQFTQSKSVNVTGQVKYIDLFTQQTLNVFPITSQFEFEHVFAKKIGDKRALEATNLDLLQATSVDFPSNEQMIYDTGNDLKQQLKHIITRNKFSR